MLDDIGPWDFTYGESPEELLRVEPDGKIIVGDIVLDGWKDVVRRIKATSHLSAEDAETAAEVVWNHRIGTMPDEELDAWVESLRAYAKALGGKR